MFDFLFEQLLCHRRSKRIIKFINLRLFQFVLISHFLISLTFGKITDIVTCWSILTCMVVSCNLIILLFVRLHPVNLRLSLSWKRLWLRCTVQWLSLSVFPVDTLRQFRRFDWYSLSFFPIDCSCHFSLSVFFIDLLFYHIHHILLFLMLESAGYSGLAVGTRQKNARVATWRLNSRNVLAGNVLVPRSVKPV